MVFVSKPTKMQSQYTCEFIRGNIILINLIRKFSKISAKWAKLKMILILRMTTNWSKRRLKIKMLFAIGVYTVIL